MHHLQEVEERMRRFFGHLSGCGGCLAGFGYIGRVRFPHVTWDVTQGPVSGLQQGGELFDPGKGEDFDFIIQRIISVARVDDVEAFKLRVASASVRRGWVL